MFNHQSLTGTVSHFLHRRFLWLLLAAYAAAALVPGPGLWLKNLTLLEFPFLGEQARVTLPMLMLAVLLLNAGLGADTSRPRELLKGLPLLVTGLAASLVLPLAFTAGVAVALRPWPEPDEAQSLVVGLALVAAMPVAGSSTAWSQNNNGEVSFSLALVLLSTLLSPLTTPVVLHAASWWTTGEYAVELGKLAAGGTSAFLLACVALPSLLGVLGRRMVGGSRIDSARPHFKLINYLVLLLLNYGNGAVSLPQAVAYPDLDFLAVIVGATVGLCTGAFRAGWWLGRLFGADRARCTSLMFGLGMSNNGSGLVLAGMALSAYPRAMLPILIYNLVQHLTAGAAASLLWRGESRQPTDQPSRRGNVMDRTASSQYRAMTSRVLCLLASLTLVAPAAAAEPSTLELVQTIPLKGAPGRLDHLAIDTKGGRLFVANLSNNSLDIIDLKAGKLVAQIPHQQKIQGVAHTPDVDRIFVGNGVDGVCNVFDGRTYKLVGSIKLEDADNVRCDPRSRQVYVTHSPSALSVIDVKTLKLKATIKLPGPPEALQLHPSEPRLYVNTLKPAQVVAIDTEKNEVVNRFPLTLAESNYPLALDPAGGRIFVGCRKKPSIVVLDMKTGKEIASVAIPGDIDDLFYDAKRRRLYASCGEGFLAVVEAKERDRYHEVERVETGKLARTCLFDSDGGRLYLPVPRQKGKDGGPEIRVFQARD
jgi:BASS family bile acid:Na+ symporter